MLAPPDPAAALGRKPILSDLSGSAPPRGVVICTEKDSLRSLPNTRVDGREGHSTNRIMGQELIETAVALMITPEPITVLPAILAASPSKSSPDPRIAPQIGIYTSRMEMVQLLVKWVALSVLLSSGAWGHFLPLDQCDFYFQGHRETAPMLDVMVTRNLTASPPILTKGDKEVVAAEIRTECAFLPDPSMLFEKRSCAGHFHVKKHHLSGRFANQEFASLEAFRFHQVLLVLESAELADGTLLNQNDTNTEYKRPRRCVTFLTTPAIIPHYNTGTGPQRGDIITKIVDLVPKLLNTEHRKKLNRIATSAQQVGRDMGALAQDVADFP